MGNDGLGLETIDDDQLLAAGGAGHEADGAAGDPQLVGDQPEKRLIGSAGDRGCRNVRPEDPVDHAVDMIGPGARRQANGETDVVTSQDSAQPSVMDRVPEDEFHGPSLAAAPGRVRQVAVLMTATIATIMVVRALAEQRLANPNHGGAFLDGNVEVGAHPHR